MADNPIRLTGKERYFPENEIIVSKTDPRGRITYANDIFLEVSGYSENELLGRPHNIIRHPDMPRCVFKLLWGQIATGRECFAYVNNLAKNGDNYWVFAHVTPNFDADGRIVGYHSSRRVPRRDAVGAIQAVYADLRSLERREADVKKSLEASFRTLLTFFAEKGKSYDEFILSL